MTATLTPKVRRDIHSQLHFSKGLSRFFNTGNDRPTVSIIVRACEYLQNSYWDLDFIIPSTVNTFHDVPKTYIYVDDIRIGGEIVDHLTSILHARNSNLATKGLIRPFNATLSHEYRDAAMQAFRDNQDSTNSGGNIRILVCTDAAGMVCHLC